MEINKICTCRHKNILTNYYIPMECLAKRKELENPQWKGYEATGHILLGQM
jgi:hypothetical protein